MTDNTGLHQKYLVERTHDPSGKHADCWYFVLDPQHDEHARTALAVYAEACRRDAPSLADDLTVKLRRGQGGKPEGTDHA